MSALPLPHPPLSFPSPVPSAPAMQAATDSSISAQGSQAVNFPEPHVNATTPSGPTTGFLTVPQGPGRVSGPSSTSSVTLHSVSTSTSGISEPDSVAAQRQAICDAWTDAEGEIPVLDKTDMSSWTPIFSAPLASKDRGDGDSWRDGLGALLNNYFMLLEESPTGTTQSSHIIRPIPLECLRLASFDGEKEVRKQDLGIFRRIMPCYSSPPTEFMYPFTIYHDAAKITRRYTLYTQSATERNRWYTVLKDAAEARTAKQRGNILYTLQTLDDEFFHVPPRLLLTPGRHFTGQALCAAEFSFQGVHYIAVGCTNGIYVSDRTSNSPFRSVLESDKPTSIAAIPESNAFLVHCESKLFSYRLDGIIRVSQGDAEPKKNIDWETRLAQDSGDVLFFKAGCIANQTWKVVYSAKNSKQVTSHVLEVTRQDQDPQYRSLGSPMSTPEDPHDATFLSNEVAICTSKAIYVVEPTNTTSGCRFREVVPEFPNSKPSTNTFRRVLKGIQSLFRTKKSDTLKVLGSVESGQNTLIIYDELGYFIDEHDKPAGSTYYVSWECRPTAYARRGSHLLLFSPKFIEVRSIDTGALVQVIERADVRPLRCGWTGHDMLVAATAGAAASDGSRGETLVEVV